MAVTVYQQNAQSSPVLVQKWKIPFLYVSNVIWNLLRKPLVKYWHHELIMIANRLHRDVTSELLPVIYDYMRQNCSHCRDLYGYLRGETFVSQIKVTLEKHRCTTHSEPYLKFLIDHDMEFYKSKQLSDKICGFVSGEK